MPEDVDRAVRSRMWRVSGWRADGSEMLAPIWLLPENVSRPRAMRKRKFEEVSHVSPRGVRSDVNSQAEQGARSTQHNQLLALTVS